MADHGDESIYRCPCVHHASIKYNGSCYLCEKLGCIHSFDKDGFAIYDGTPIFISTALTDTVCLDRQVESYVPRGERHVLIRGILRNLLSDSVTENNCAVFCELVRQGSETPRVLVIGAGEKGVGTKRLWDDKGIVKHGIDIYRSNTVDTICDAHYLPFADGTFDAVWIQAVLEHVVEPLRVVNEINRVLTASGIVYAETPFMQQVHEGAYDFTRYTIRGQRFLFRAFSKIDAGPLGGPDLVLAWSVRYFVWGLTRSSICGKAIGFFVSIMLRPFRALLSSRSVNEGCSGVFFLGRKDAAAPLGHRDLISSA